LHRYGRVRWQQLVLIAAACGDGNASGELYSYGYRDLRELEPAGGIDGDGAIRRPNPRARWER